MAGPYTRVDPGDTLASVGTGDVTHEFMHEEIAQGLEDVEAVITRDVATITTGSLADDATENGTVVLRPMYRLFRVDVDRACRVRLYTSSAKRTADAARAVGTDVDIATDHGLMFEYVATAAIDVDLSPLVDGFCPTGSTVYYAIENRSGSTHTVVVAFDWIGTELG